MNIIGKFMLVGCMERDIQNPMFFDTYEQVFEKMCEQFGDVWKMTVAEVKEKFCDIPDDEFDPDGDGFVGHYSAFTERYGNNYDWKIFSVSDLIKED